MNQLLLSPETKPNDFDPQKDIQGEIDTINARVNKAGLAFAFTIAATKDETAADITLYKSDQRHPQILDERFSYGSLRVHFESGSAQFTREWMDVALDCAMNDSEKAVYARNVERVPV